VKLVRDEGKPATGDKDVDLVYEYTGNVRDYFNKVLKRNSIDNSGMDLILFQMFLAAPSPSTF
jgi:Zn-dependent metalloprotease